jgi:hypothetical protein
MLPFMQPLAYVAGGYSKPASYVTGGSRSGIGNSTILDLTGATAGDYIIFAPYSASVVAGGDGNWTIQGTHPAIHTKRLTAADLVPGTLTCGTYPWCFAIYRKPQSHQIKAEGYNGGGGSGVLLSGFNKDDKSAGVIVITRGGGGGSAPLTDPQYTLRQFVLYTSPNISSIRIYDLLSPKVYTNGSSVLANGSANTSVEGAILELLNSGTGAGAGPGGPFGSTNLDEDGNPMFNVIL